MLFYSKIVLKEVDHIKDHIQVLCHYIEFPEHGQKDCMGITTVINSLFKKILTISCYFRFLELYLLNVKYFKEVKDKICL